MFENMDNDQAKKQILDMVAEYCDKYHAKKEYKEGDRIPYASRVYDHDEMCNLVDSALEFWLTSGRFTKEFETKFAEYLGVKYCSLVNSGSSANLLAFMTLTSPLLGDRQVKPGDEMITVAAGFPTTVTPAIQYGVVPVFIDVTLPQYNMDINMLEQALSDKTRLVMAAHTLGNPFNLNAIKAFCEKHNLWLIEDNCDALGSTVDIEVTDEDKIADRSKIFTKADGKKYIKKLTGTVGDIGTSSFYPPHHMTMGEGGAVYTDNPLLNKIAKSLRDWGRDCVCVSGQDNMCGHRFDGQFGELPKGYDHKYVYSHFGYNLKATDMQASVGCAQIVKFPGFVERRKHNYKRLFASLYLGKTGLTEAEVEKVINETEIFTEKHDDASLIKAADGKMILPTPVYGSDPSWFGFLITLDGPDRNKVVPYIEEKGVQTRMLFAGNLTKHPCFDEMRASGRGYRVVGTLENTDRIMNNTFWVGVYPGMTDAMIDYMAKTILDAIYR